VNVSTNVKKITHSSAYVSRREERKEERGERREERG
jgi:hypothetical protein